MLELCMVIGLSLGYVGGVVEKVYTLDCGKSSHYVIVDELEDDFIEVIKTEIKDEYI